MFDNISQNKVMQCNPSRSKLEQRPFTAFSLPTLYIMISEYHPVASIESSDVKGTSRIQPAYQLSQLISSAA